MSNDYRIVSVAMATYNGEQYIEEQLDSIRMQTKKVDEIIIVDDGSTDRTVEMILEYAKKHSDCNIKFAQNDTNLGYKKNFCKAMSLCNGDIIFLCDQDDKWFKNKVECLCELLDERSEIGVISTAFTQMDGNGVPGEQKSAYQRKMKKNELAEVPLKDLIFHNVSQGCAMAMRKEIKNLYLQAFDDTIPHDWIINVIAAMKKKCYYWNVPMFFYRIHDNNTIGLSDNMAFQKKNTMEVRTKDAICATRVLNFIEKFDSDYYRENSWLEKAKGFSFNHVKFLKEGLFWQLLFQNLNPCYGKLKTIRGRILDMFFVLKK